MISIIERFLQRNAYRIIFWAQICIVPMIVFVTVRLLADPTLLNEQPLHGLVFLSACFVAAVYWLSGVWRIKDKP